MFVAYGAAKAALDRMTRNIAPELAPRVRVNAIDVGGVATRSLDIVLTDDELRQQFLDGTPMGRPGEPEDIACAVLYLGVRRLVLGHREGVRDRRRHGGTGDARPGTGPHPDSWEPGCFLRRAWLSHSGASSAVDGLDPGLGDRRRLFLLRGHVEVEL